ncbi:hypothetical protein ONZ45_g9939 [Pleurotus djamor]|nr:hypothetical protein ONZ45_g9939 [Pleurotus djamor]
MQLTLFDGSSNSYITEAIDLESRFPSGDYMTITFFVTTLDLTCSVVLGHDFLTRFNPLIDWVTGQIQFRTPIRGSPAPTTLLTPSKTSPSNPEPRQSLPKPTITKQPAPNPPTLKQLPRDSTAKAQSCHQSRTPMIEEIFDDPPIPATPSNPEPLDSSPEPLSEFLPNGIPRVSQVNAAAFKAISRLRGTTVYQLVIRPESAKAKATSCTAFNPDLAKVPEEYHEFADVFSKGRAETLAEHRPYDLKIDLEEGAKPPVGGIIPLSQAEQLTVKKFIDEHLGMGFIRSTNSPHGAPVLFAKKKDGSLRLCVDYRGLNKVTRRDRYPLPLIADLLDAPKKARYYTKIDLRHAYHLIRVREGDEWKTAFRTCYGSYEWLVMPFGLTNAPAAFQRFMNDIFGDLIDKCVIVYLDDILIYSDSLEEHKKTVKEVLRRLRANKLYAKGYILSPDGLKMSEDKIKVIQDWPKPRKVKDVQSFLGKGVKWKFNPASKAAFEKLKHRPMVIETDASDYALGAIFAIYTDDGKIHPVVFHSCTFANAELNYDVHNKELLAIHEAFKVWSRYLDGSGSPIDVFTDHKNLEYFKILTRRQAPWSEFLSQFNFTIHYRPGRLGAKPNTLTRRWDMYSKEGENSYAKGLGASHVTGVPRGAVTRSLTGLMIMNTDKLHEDIKAAYSRDSDLSKPLEELGPCWSLDAAGFVCLDGQIYVPNADDLCLRILQNKHDHILAGHPGQTKTLALIRREHVWPNLCSFVIDYCKSCVTCMHAKPQCHKPYGLLRQLPVPSRPWDSISMDFIEKLPPSLGFDSILVVVDRLSKQGVFIPCHNTITSEGLAKLFVMHIFSKHGVPQHVTSDRGSEFVLRFFQSLGKALKIELHFTSGYHPEGDGQTERTNQTLEQYLRIYCNYQQDNWAELLPLAEFTYNNAPHSTIGVSPFFANKGYNPSIAIQAELDLSSPQAQTYVSNLEDVHAELRRTMAEAQAWYQGPADKRRSPQPDFKIGDEVFLKSKFFKVTCHSKKLANKNLGPYKILERVGYSSFLIQLPDVTPHI